MTRMLTCPAGCAAHRFEALNAPLFVDSAGRYMDHEASQAAYVCAECGSVAIDLAAARREAQSRGREAEPSTLVCPGCDTEMLPPEDDPEAALVECPVCGTRFSLDEGRPRLHGGRRRERSSAFGLDLDELDDLGPGYDGGGGQRN